MKARVERATTYTVTADDAEAWIACRPQQIWECRDRGRKVTASWKNVSLTIPKEEFEKHWKVVEE